VFVQGDGEFKPLKDLIESELYGGPTMNLTSANEHDPEIERKHRVIKECQVCAHQSSVFSLVLALRGIPRSGSTLNQWRRFGGFRFDIVQIV